MKNKINLLAILVLLFAGDVVAKDAKSKTATFADLVSIDSRSLMQRSKEGQKLAKEIQKDIDEFQKYVQNAQKEVIDYQETITKQAKVLSKDALMDKGEKLAKLKKNAERDLTDKEEALKMNLQKKQTALVEKQMGTAKEVFEGEGWGLMIDRNTPGVLFVSNAIDKTDEVLKAVDDQYEKHVAKSIVEKEKSKTSKVIKDA